MADQDMPQPLLEKACRRAYERGRAQKALFCGLLALPMPLLAEVLAAPRTTSGLLFVLLFGTLSGLAFLGDEHFRGGRAGLLMGAAPLLIAICARRLGHFCVDSVCINICFGLSALAGLFAGVRLAKPIHELRELGQKSATTYLSAALLTTLIAALVGCVALGAGSLLGLFAGLAIGLVPGYLLATRSV